MNSEAYTGQEDSIELSNLLGSIFDLHRRRVAESEERGVKIAVLNDQLEDCEKRAKRVIELEREIELLKAEHSSETTTLQAKLIQMQRKHELELEAVKKSALESARSEFKSKVKALWESCEEDEYRVEDRARGQNSRNRKRNTLYSEYDLVRLISLSTLTFELTYSCLIQHDTKLKSLGAFDASTTSTSPTIAGEETPVGFARYATCGYQA
ncbi:hypothetical protein AAF712_009261 [Marasmius tenuissimus]|uniref:Uncharacterized protein n=1 Tax=Marasmius tenuissimus TaxID=585030 RepID=A0ABR2ZQ56_9AGAR